MIDWQYFSKSDAVPTRLSGVIEAFGRHQDAIGSPQNTLVSNGVLAVLRDELISLGFEVETGKRASEKIRIPVLFGRRGNPNLSFEADAAHYGNKTVLEIEAGRAVTNYQFLKDLFQAFVMQGISYAVMAVRNVYKGSRDFETEVDFLDTMYASRRLKLPLDGVLIIGY